MELYDQHLHSRHSFDSRTDPSENVRSGLARGLSGLTFTEHFDTHPDDWKGCIYDDDAYSATIESLRAEFAGAIFIGKGIEVCYQPDRMEFILDFLDSHSFDLIILSVHYFGERAVFKRENWAGVDAAEGTRRYLNTVLEAVRFCERLHRTRGRRVFDVLGHLDLAKRYTQRFFGTDVVCRFATLLEEILQTCLSADLIPEVNTSSLRQDLSEPMPGFDTIARYVKLGGTAMSIGSDAHTAADVGADLDQILPMLQETGVRSVPVFSRRERRLVPLA